MSKQITQFTAQLVTFETIVPVVEVLARLDKALNKQGSGKIWSSMKDAQNKEEIESSIKQITNENDFLYFFELAHHRWLNAYSGIDSTPVTAVYTLGNPLIAQTILQHDLRAGLNIPLRVLVLEKEDRSGTNVLYQLPSSVMDQGDNAQLKEAAEALDARLEKLVTEITSVE